MGTKLLLTKWESTDENKKNNGINNHNAYAAVASHNSATDRTTIAGLWGVWKSPTAAGSSNALINGFLLVI
jgi:hypothetical protein